MKTTTFVRGALRRRAAMAGLSGATLSLALGQPSLARGPSVRPESMRSVPGPGRLDLLVVHTGETFSDVFADGGGYDQRRLAKLNRLLRDFRTGEVKSIDPALFDMLARVQSQVGQPLRILSGYRSRETNRLLHMAGFDVAEHSLHIAAKAVDFMVPGVPAARLGEICRHCGADGGLGVYRSGFVHIDTGARRNWTGD